MLLTLLGQVAETSEPEPTPDDGYQIHVDLDNDGLWESGGEMTSRVRPTQPAAGQLLAESKRGYDPSQQLHMPRAGVLSFEVDNDDGTLGPGSTLRQGRPVRWRTTVSATTYQLFRGHLQRPAYKPVRALRHNVAVPALSSLALLVGKRVSTALYENVTTGEAVGYLLDAAGWPAFSRQIDTGKAEMGWWWLDEEDAFTALIQLLVTEGEGAQLYETAEGVIVFKDRHAIWEDTASATVQRTFRSAPGSAEPVFDDPFEYDIGIRDVVNDVRREVVQRAATSVQDIWSLAGTTVALGASESRSFLARASSGDPFTGAVVPASFTDYTLVSGSVTASLSRTSGGNTVVTFTAGSGGAVFTDPTLRAQPVPVTSRSIVEQTYDGSASQAEYDVRTYPYSPRAEVSADEAGDWCNLVAFSLADGIEYARLTLSAEVHADRKTAALASELGERVRVIDAESSVDLTGWVEQVQHTLTAPNTLRTMLSVRGLPGVQPFILDTSELDSATELVWA